ncbi:MAG: carboxypeptidase regulatory-like domain-containing protein [Candidatus Sulfotelmatobacter sp.]
MKLRRGLWFAYLGFLLSVVPVFAQVNGVITGTVRDHSGAVISGAEVTVSDADKGIHRTTPTNSDGDYLVGGLGASTYNVTVTASGFEKYQAKGIVLRVGEKIRIDCALTVGKVSAQVVVEGSAAGQVETQSSEVAGTISGKQISQLELNGRNFVQLITLIPGVSNQSGQDEGTVGVAGNVLYAINGGRTEYNNWEVDGGDNMDNGSNGSLNVYPNVDALAEVRVITSSYGAQYGRNGSGTIEAVTKSGTNSFHGEVFEFLRNELFNAHNYFDAPGIDKPAYKKNDFGYILGGPIRKDKTFFFWSQEFRREDVPFNEYNQRLPSPAERGGDFSDVCPAAGTPFYRNALTAPLGWTDFYPDCPAYQLDTADSSGSILAFYGFNNNNLNGSMNGGQSQIDAVNSGPLINLIPLPNAPGNFFQESWPQYTHWHEELFKIDQNFTSKIHGNFRFIHDSWQQFYPVSPWSGSSVPTIGGTIIGPGVSIVANLTANTSPTLLNEFVFSYTTDHLSLLQGSNAWQRPSSMTMAGIFNNGFGGELPKFVISNGNAYSGGFTVDTSSAPWFNSNPTYTYKDNVTKILGKHNLMFGGYFVAAQKNEDASVEPQGWLNFYGDPGSAYTGSAQDAWASTGNAFADMQIGQINQFGQASKKIKYYFRYKIFEPYLQDDWHATKKLTLNLGLRVSFYGTYRERYGQAYNFDPALYNAANAPTISPVDGSLVFPAGQSINTLTGMVQCGSPGVPVGCMKGHLVNPAPRIGFAFDPKGDGKSAIRGGYGIFFEHMNGDEANVESLEGQPPLVVNSYQSFIPGVQNGPSGYLNIGGASGGGSEYFPIQVYSIPDKAIWPYVQQWHLDFQRQVTHATLVTVAYVGSKGTHLSLMRDINQLQPVPASDNPYALGQPITGPDCINLGNGINQLANGTPVVGQAITNLNVACGNVSADSVRTNFPGYDQIQRIDLFANSNYNALQVSGRHNAGGLELTLAYTYSHSIDDSSDRYDSSFVNSYDIPASRASSTYDQRHILTVSYVYDLPLFRHSRGKTKTLLGGWQLSGITTMQTGEPFSIINGGYYDNAGVANGAGSGAYADIVGNPHAPTPASERFAPQVVGPLLFNPAAYQWPQGLTFGDSGRDSLNWPRRTNFDMGLFKHFAMGESKAIEFRAEGFNVFNHPQWNGVNNYSCGASFNSGDVLNCVEGDTATGTQATNFLHPGGAHNPRIGQFGMKIIF